MELVETVEFDDETGLVPAVVQDAGDGRVLMLAYMNRRALERTLEGGQVTFWSRSRQELWEKGATSGNWLEAVEVCTDCDHDALLVRARPHGPACHTGEASCFEAGRRRRVDGARSADGGPAEPPESGAGAGGGGGPSADARPGAGPGRTEGAAPGEADAGDTGDADPGPRRTAPGRGDDAGPDLSGAGRSPAPVLASVLEELVEVVARRDRERPEGSYTASLLEAGPRRAARKVGEEALEVVIAALEEPRELAAESADLLYHLAVLWRAVGLPADAVGRELAGRRSGRDGMGGGGEDPTGRDGGGDRGGDGPASGDEGSP